MRKPGKIALARARKLYDEGAAPLHDIAAGLRISAASFRALRKREGWPPRSKPADHPAAPAKVSEAVPDQTADEALDTRMLERRLVRALRREIARAETEIENASHPGAERKARILGLLVKTLGDLRRLDTADKTKERKAAHESGSDDPPRDDPPRDLAALRQALVDRLEGMRRDGEAR